MLTHIIAKLVLHIPGLTRYMAGLAYARTVSFTKQCTYCHEEIMIDSVYCRLCGMWQEDATLSKRTQETEPMALKPRALTPMSIAERDTQLVLLSARDRAKLRAARLQREEASK